MNSAVDARHPAGRNTLPQIRVGLWGLGAMGTAIGRLIRQRAGLELVAAVDIDAAKIGQPLGRILDDDGDFPRVTANGTDAFLQAQPDVVIIATGSFFRQVLPQIETAMQAGANVITIAEEMASPAMVDPDGAARLHALAIQAGVSVLGTGVNPGFAMDALVIALTSVCADVQHIHVRRVNDLAPYGPTVLQSQGVGLTPEAFAAGVSQGTVVGHVGFPQSLAMVAAALGWKLDEIKEERLPIISRVQRQTPHITVVAGQVAGCNHTARGFNQGREVITLEHPQQVCPEAEGVETGDFIDIAGIPPIHLAIRPEIAGGTATAALAVNLIDTVMAAPPGLISMADVRLPGTGRRMVGPRGRREASRGQTAVRGDWVELHDILLPAGERASQVPADTQGQSFQIRCKGFLMEDAAQVGDRVRIQTLTGRVLAGELIAQRPASEHHFGRPVQELLSIGPDLRRRLHRDV